MADDKDQTGKDVNFEVNELDKDLEDASGGSCGGCAGGCSGCGHTGCSGCTSCAPIDKEVLS